MPLHQHHFSEVESNTNNVNESEITEFGNKNDDDAVIILAVVEWEEPSAGTVTNVAVANKSHDEQDNEDNESDKIVIANDDNIGTSVVRRTKLRIFRRDIIEMMKWRMAEFAVDNDVSVDIDIDIDIVHWQRLLYDLILRKMKRRRNQQHPSSLSQKGDYDKHDSQPDANTMTVEVYDASQSDYVSLLLPSSAVTAMVMACRRQVNNAFGITTNDLICNGGCDRRPVLVRLRLRATTFETTTSLSSDSNNLHNNNINNHHHHHHIATTNGWLAITGRYIPYHYGMDFAGTQLMLQEQPNGVGTGGTIWDGAMLLAKYFESHPETVSSKSVLELGAGTGLVGIAAGLVGAREVLMTDLAYCLPLLQENIHRHASILLQRGVCQRMDCRVLDWNQHVQQQQQQRGDDDEDQQPPQIPSTVTTTIMHDLLFPVGETEITNSNVDHYNNNHYYNNDHDTNNSTYDHGRTTIYGTTQSKYSWMMEQQNGPDVIVIADCVWVEELVIPLLSTLKRLLSLRCCCHDSTTTTTTTTKIYISYQRRGKAAHEAFWSGLQALLFAHPSTNDADHHPRITPLDIDASIAARLPPNLFYLWECCY